MKQPIFLVRPELITALALDFAKLTMAEGDIAKELSTAPYLDNWSVGMPRAKGLTGTVTGHPTISDGEIQTSTAYIVAGDLTWARTLSRFYRLGRRAR